MKQYRLLTCLKCDHQFKSNVESKFPHCSLCGSFDWIESKQLVNKSKMEKEINHLKDYALSLNAKIKRQNSIIDELVAGHNDLCDTYTELKNSHAQPTKTRPRGKPTKEARPLTMDEAIDAL